MSVKEKQEKKKPKKQYLRVYFEYFISMEMRAALDLKLYEQQFLLFVAYFKKKATERCVQ